MPTLTVSRTVSAEPDAVWALLSDFANVSWIPVAADVTIVGAGPGMRRTIWGSGDQSSVERLIRLDSARRVFAYEIEQSPMPVSRYIATVAVADAQQHDQDPGGNDARTTVTWDVEYEPRVDDEHVRAGIEKVYTAMAGWLTDAVGAH